jgi:hypothetical protein
MAFAQQLAAQPASPIDRLLAQDVRLAAVAERLLGANRALCRQMMPLTGLVLHSRDQYRADVAGTASPTVQSPSRRCSLAPPRPPLPCVRGTG